MYDCDLCSGYCFSVDILILGFVLPEDEGEFVFALHNKNASFHVG